MAGYFGFPQAALDAVATKYYDAAVKAIQQEVRMFVAENILLGIQGSGKVKLIGDAMKNVSYFASTGSLYQVYDALEQIKITPDMAPFMTEARKQYLKNRVLAIITAL